jgi:hypothetical protein
VHNKQLNDYLLHICSCHYTYAYIFHARYQEAHNGDTGRDRVVVTIVESVCACVVVIIVEVGGESTVVSLRCGVLCLLSSEEKRGGRETLTQRDFYESITVRCHC